MYDNSQEQRRGGRRRGEEGGGEQRRGGNTTLQRYTQPHTALAAADIGIAHNRASSGNTMSRLATAASTVAGDDIDGGTI
jgi:hypothetical protein